MDKKISYSALLAFSLVELMISLITISLIAAAFAPVITKKLSTSGLSIGSFGSGSNNGKDNSDDCDGDETVVEFIEAGEHSFEVPDGIKELTVTLVSGGGGGGAGNMQQVNHTFVSSGTGNSANNGTTELLTVSDTGLVTYTVPDVIKNKNVLLTLCGGGGGGAYAALGNMYNGASGGNGEYVTNKMISTNNSFLYFHLGGGGAANGQSIPDAWGGSYSGGADGYNIFTQSRTKGGGSPGSWCGKSGGWGASYGGGGSSNAEFGTWAWNRTTGGGGGAATFVYTSKNAEGVLAIASGGGGAGGSYRYNDGDGQGPGGCGGGGGGPKGGSGGNGNLAGGGAANGGVNGSYTIFGSNYCSGGNGKYSGKSGALRMSYVSSSTSATGGGAGKIVPNQKISVTPKTTIKIVVGNGGSGGTAGYLASDGAIKSSSSGQAGQDSYIQSEAGVTLITTATGSGATGGNPNGSTVGIAGNITSGISSEDASSAFPSFSSTNGGSGGNNTTGGIGGQTTLDNQTLHCNGGVGGNNSNGADATGYGGCGGGGGYGGFNGGKGAVGYVKISYKTGSCQGKCLVQNCVTCVTSDKCLTCNTGYIPNSEGVCEACSTGKYFEDNSCKTCPIGYSCDGMTKKLCADGTFNEITNASTCNECPSGYYCYNGEKHPCPNGKYSNASASYCLSCDSSCVTCSLSPTNCTSCANNKLLKENVCTTCPDYAICNGSSNLNCIDGYTLENGSCVEDSPTFNYTGSYTQKENENETLIYFLASGQFTPNFTKNVKLTVIGGGGGSGANSDVSSVCYSYTANAGCGGNIQESDYRIVKKTIYPITIGSGGWGPEGCWTKTTCYNGGTGGESSFGNIKAAGGEGGLSCENTSDANSQSCSQSPVEYYGKTYSTKGGGNDNNTGNGGKNYTVNGNTGGSGIVIMRIPK